MATEQNRYRERNGRGALTSQPYVFNPCKLLRSNGVRVNVFITKTNRTELWDCDGGSTQTAKIFLHSLKSSRFMRNTLLLRHTGHARRTRNTRNKVGMNRIVSSRPFSFRIRRTSTHERNCTHNCLAAVQAVDSTTHRASSCCYVSVWVCWLWRWLLLPIRLPPQDVVTAFYTF